MLEALKETDNSIIEKLANQVGLTANTKYIYGEPVECDDITVIPVAKAAYAFGGGGGKKGDEGGSGGGGAVSLTPVGYIEIKNGETKFRQIVDLAMLLPLITVSSLALLSVFWGIGKLLRMPKNTQ